jgi:hypothetical protein
MVDIPYHLLVFRVLGSQLAYLSLRDIAVFRKRHRLWVFHDYRHGSICTNKPRHDFSLSQATERAPYCEH